VEKMRKTPTVVTKYKIEEFLKKGEWKMNKIIGVLFILSGLCLDSTSFIPIVICGISGIALLINTYKEV
jgi:hypothetical protein